MFHIVDDQPYLSDMLGQLLGSLGYAVETFTCPQAYLDYAASEEFTMPFGTITDIDMPIMNGYEMMRRLHHIHPSLKFVVVTGEPYIEHEYKSKACMYLSKPFRMYMLSAITQHLSDCLTHGPLKEKHCSDCDNRADFNLPSWICPAEEAAGEKKLQ